MKMKQDIMYIQKQGIFIQYPYCTFYLARLGKIVLFGECPLCTSKQTKEIEDAISYVRKEKPEILNELEAAVKSKP